MSNNSEKHLLIYDKFDTFAYHVLQLEKSIIEVFIAPKPS